MTDVPRTTLLDPATLARVKDLRLIARTLVDGVVAGLHRQPRAGVGVELEQFRAYQPGDDPRRIDWRAHARSDRLIVRESPVERDVTVRLVLDASASMGVLDGVAGAPAGALAAARPESGGESALPTVAKLHYARMLAAALAFLALRQGDAVALHVVGDGNVDLPPLRRRRALERLLFALEQVRPSGRWAGWDELGARLTGVRAGRPRRRQLVVILSDLWEEAGEIGGALARLRALRQEVVVLHLVGRDELDFPWRGDVAFEDLETGATLAGNAAELRPQYMGRLEAWLKSWERRCAELAIAYHRVPLDRPLELSLRDVLARRRRMR